MLYFAKILNLSKSSSKKFVAFFVFLLAFLFATPVVFAVSFQADSEEKWTLRADTVRADNASKFVEAEGNVILTRAGEFLKADFVRYFSDTGWVFLQGNVDVMMKDVSVAAEEAELDLHNQTGWFKNGQVFITASHLYAAGSRINKHWGDVYSFEDAKISMCSGDNPAWSLAAQEAVVEIDGYARLTWPQFQIKNHSVLTFPAFAFPVKTTRQTGLLRPEFGRSSRDGVYYQQSLFWVLNETSDITITANMMTSRGLMGGLEYRSIPHSGSKTFLMMDGLFDSKRIRSESEDEIRNYDGLIRTNKDRFWLRGMHDGDFFLPNWRIRMDLDYVSDQNYLEEFKNYSLGYTTTRDRMASLFNRDLNENHEYRTSQVQLLYDWDRLGFAVSARYDQNPGLGNGNSKTDTIAQRLPQMDAFLNKGRIFDELPFEIDGSFQFVTFHRETGHQGMRYMFVPRLTLPLRSQYGSIVATTALHQTNYVTENHAPLAGESGSNRGENRTLTDTTVTAQTELSRIFPLDTRPLQIDTENIGQTRWRSVQHTVQPRVHYGYTTNDGQENNPYYDSLDRIGARNTITYSITNILSRSRERVVPVKGEDGSPAVAVRNDYLEFAKFKVQQTYDLRESTRNTHEEYSKQPFRDILFELELRPIDVFAWRNKLWYSPYDNRITQNDMSFTYNLDAFNRVGIGYNYRQARNEYLVRRPYSIESVSVLGEFQLFSDLSFGGSVAYDYAKEELVDATAQLIWRNDCYTLYFKYVTDSNDDRFELSFDLGGLIGFGK